MKHCYNAVICAHEGVGVVFDVVTPMRVRNVRVDVDELPGEESHHIQHVDALVQQNAAAGDLPPCAPILIKAHHLRFAVDAPQTEDVTELTGPNDPERVADGVVVAMVEAVFQLEPGVSGFNLADAHDVLDVTTRGLFTANVQPTLETRHRHGGCDVVPEAHEEHVEVFLEEFAPIGPAAYTVDFARIADRLVTHGDGPQAWMRIDVAMPDLSRAPISGDSYP